MIVRLALLLLAVALVVSVAGRLRRSLARRRPFPIESARQCPDCAAYLVGSRPDPCSRRDCRFRAP